MKVGEPSEAIDGDDDEATLYSGAYISVCGARHAGWGDVFFFLERDTRRFIIFFSWQKNANLFTTQHTANTRLRTFCFVVVSYTNSGIDLFLSFVVPLP